MNKRKNVIDQCSKSNYLCQTITFRILTSRKKINKHITNEWKSSFGYIKQYHQSSWLQWWVCSPHHLHDHNHDGASMFEFVRHIQSCLFSCSLYLQKNKKSTKIKSYPGNSQFRSLVFDWSMPLFVLVSCLFLSFSVFSFTASQPFSSIQFKSHNWRIGNMNLLIQNKTTQ